MYFTLGQRQGIGIGGVKGRDQASWYVAHKDQNSNQLIESFIAKSDERIRKKNEKETLRKSAIKK